MNSNNFEIILKITILGFIPLIIYKINKRKFNKLYNKYFYKLVNKDNNINLKVLKNFKKIKFNIKKLDIDISFFSKNYVLSSYIVVFISSVLSYIISKSNNDEIKYKIMQLNSDKDIKLSFSGIFEFNMMHIINILISFKRKRRCLKNERSSNRRSYDFGYE